MTTAALPTEAHARRGDGDTSHAAAASVRRMTGKHNAVLLVLTSMRDYVTRDGDKPYADGMTHPEIIRWYAYAQERKPDRFPLQTDQSIRSRCAELVDAGMVTDTGIRRRLPTGRNAKVWAAPTVG